MVLAGRTRHLVIVIDRLILALGEEGRQLPGSASFCLCVDHLPSRWTFRIGAEYASCLLSVTRGDRSEVFR